MKEKATVIGNTWMVIKYHHIKLGTKVKVLARRQTGSMEMCFCQREPLFGFIPRPPAWIFTTDLAFKEKKSTESVN